MPAIVPRAGACAETNRGDHTTAREAKRETAKNPWHFFRVGICDSSLTAVCQASNEGLKVTSNKDPPRFLYPTARAEWSLLRQDNSPPLTGLAKTKRAIFHSTGQTPRQP